MKLKPLYTDDFFKKKSIDDIQASLSGTTIEQSALGRKKNTDLLQEDEEQEAEDVNDDADINAKVNKIDVDKNNIIISMDEDQNTL